MEIMPDARQQQHRVKHWAIKGSGRSRTAVQSDSSVYIETSHVVAKGSVLPDTLPPAPDLTGLTLRVNVYTEYILKELKGFLKTCGILYAAKTIKVLNHTDSLLH